MKNPTRFCVGLVLAAGVIAPLPAQDGIPPASTVAENYPASSPAELDELLGPIALYPDDLVALILPAATETTDIVLAARFLENGGSVTDVDRQPWDESVRALAHFPEVITMLNADLSWTQQVGDEFLLQPAEVMKSIQRLRQKAYAAGTLRDTPQQKVLVDGDVIRIVPAVENVVYVPSYRPEVVYVDRPVYGYAAPLITFGIGWHIGSWHRWGCDWHHHRVWVFDTHRHWRDHRWHHHHHHSGHHLWTWDHGRAWHPPHHRRHAHRDLHHRWHAGHDDHRRLDRAHRDFRRRDHDHDRRRDHIRDRDEHRRRTVTRVSRPSNPSEAVAARLFTQRENEHRRQERRVIDRDRSERRVRATSRETQTTTRRVITTPRSERMVERVRPSPSLRYRSDGNRTRVTRPATLSESRSRSVRTIERSSRSTSRPSSTFVHRRASVRSERAASMRSDSGSTRARASSGHSASGRFKGRHAESPSRRDR